MSYILIVDDEADILDMLELIIQTSTDVLIKKASSGNQALEVIQSFGHPILIVSDYKMPDGDGVFLLKSLKAKQIASPFLVCSGNPIDQLTEIFPGCTDFILKPNIMKPLKEYLQKNFKITPQVQDYVMVPLGFLRRLGFVRFDLYVRLNQEKYIKVFNAGDSLDNSDCDHIENRFLNKLFLLRSDANNLVVEFEQFLSSKSLSDPGNDASAPLVFDALQVVTHFCKFTGWSPQSVALANTTVNGTLSYVKKNKDWLKILKFGDGDDFYSTHISQLSLLCCVVAHNIGWHSEITQQKLVMAALMHDHFVDNAYYSDLDILNNLNQSSKDNKAYFQHPLKAAELARSLKGLPSDIDHIILEHHERPDGSGFPRGLSSSRISSLSALFIICESMVIYFHGKTMSQKLLDDFWHEHPQFLTKEPFKKIYLSIHNGAAHAGN